MAEFREVVALMRTGALRTVIDVVALVQPQRPMLGLNLAINLEKWWWIGG